VVKMDDDALFSSLRDKLFTAVVGDVLDKLGWRRQFLPQAVGPLRPEMKIVGRAMPVLEADVFEEGSGSPGPFGGKPFGLMLEALDDLRPNEVYVATGGSFRYALWGELMSTRARYLRAPPAPCSTVSSGMQRGSRRWAFRRFVAESMRRTKVLAERLSTSAHLSKSKGSASLPAT
jgi:regulator of RNase E activity RraA